MSNVATGANSNATVAGAGVRGAHHLHVSISLAGAAWLVGALARLVLYLRPTPFGGPFVTHFDRYFFHALLYNFMDTVVLSLPFFVLWIALYDKVTPRKPWSVLHWLQALLLMICIALDHADSEVMRFVGVHLTPSLIALYDNTTGGQNIIFHSIATDRGGPFVSLIMLLVMPALFLGCAGWVLASLAKRVQPRSRRASLWIIILPTLLVWGFVLTPGGGFRRFRTQPFVMSLYEELAAEVELGQRPSDYDELVAEYQNIWPDDDLGGKWTFPSTEYPLVRVPEVQKVPAPEERLNVIYLQLETVRAWESQLWRPSADVEAMPFIASLATDPNGAYWPRFTSFGPPTVNGFIGGHCGITPHSHFFLTVQFAYASLYCLPQMLREHGYHAEYFTGSDPDWDGQRKWLERWYDRHEFFRDADEVDRYVFEHAAERIKEIGRRGKPFMATVVSISNHYPFRTREDTADLTDSSEVQDKIKNTTHYTDIVVRDFFDALREEPWFSKTVFIIVGDHGYNLGEHDGIPGARNAYHELTSVPLVLFGLDPGLPKGRFETQASMRDLAPTIADILGFQVTNPWQGHSLLQADPERKICISVDRQYFGEGPNYSFVRDWVDGSLLIFDAADYEQRKPLDRGELAQEMLDCAQNEQHLFDYLIETSHIWPSTWEDSRFRRPLARTK